MMKKRVSLYQKLLKGLFRTKMKFYSNPKIILTGATPGPPGTPFDRLLYEFTESYFIRKIQCLLNARLSVAASPLQSPYTLVRYNLAMLQGDGFNFELNAPPPGLPPGDNYLSLRAVVMDNTYDNSIAPNSYQVFNTLLELQVDRFVKKGDQLYITDFEDLTGSVTAILTTNITAYRYDDSKQSKALPDDINGIVPW